MSNIVDLYAEVRPRPGTLLDRCLTAICNPRKHRWNIYLRACRAIPKSSPVHGSTSWKRIDRRRHDLIARKADGVLDKDPEFIALQHVAGEAFCGSTVAHNFLLARILRRLEKRHGRTRNPTLPDPEKMV